MEQQQSRQQQIRIDETKMNTSYANTIRTSTTPDEIILDFGLNLPVQMSPNEPITNMFSVGSRVVMNWAAAKRLIGSLEQAVGAYEQHYGEIQLTRQAQQPPQPPTPPQG